MLLDVSSSSDKGGMSRCPELLDSSANGDASGTVNQIGFFTSIEGLKASIEIVPGEKVGSDSMACFKESIIRKDLVPSDLENLLLKGGGFGSQYRHVG